MIKSFSSSSIVFGCIIFIALGLRIIGAQYGVDDNCLIPVDEYWLYDMPDEISPYTWQYTPDLLAKLTIEQSTGRILFPNSDSILFWRIVGLILGTSVVAITMRIAQKHNSNLWWIMGLVVAVFPVFVTIDRWFLAYDSALFVVALIVFTIQTSLKLPSRTIIHIGAFLIALLPIIAPPLWWLMIIFWALMPIRKWETIGFTWGTCLVLLPLVRSPYHWFNSFTQWDASLTAVLIWLLLLAGMFYWQNIAWKVKLLAVGIIILGGIVSLWQGIFLFYPSDEQRAFITLAQDTLPDDAIVYLSPEVWQLKDIIACPMGSNLMIHAIPLPQAYEVNPDPRPIPDADYILRQFSSSASLAPIHFVSAPNFVIEKMATLEIPLNATFGNQFRVLSYNIETRSIKQGENLTLKFDFQYTSQVDVNTLAVGYYIHITTPNQPENKYGNFGLPLVEALGGLGKRNIVSQRVIIPIPSDIPVGTYDIRMGAVNQYTGESLLVEGNWQIVLGSLNVVP